ncbi:MAG: Ldh family oxidoreductase [Candidatus Diapherotrites archaeon]|jgi:LDH2 family malate/lactate/ureidoglycolate dehydrogenase|nr:Ldh family oxidoreductase [Candidatus Diapherotrites archaeon]MBT4596493.1 Ldh family oxidoreductase [Candidatus Diapherotrites archaeon]
MKIKISELKELCVSKLIHNLSREEAEIVFEDFLYGEAAGIKSHGFISFQGNVMGKVGLKEKELEIVKETSSCTIINGNKGLGHLIGRKALEFAAKKASEGIAISGMFNTTSWLMPGIIAREGAKKGMITLVMNNAKARTAPYGGVKARTGTNPLSIGLPLKTPFILDMATSIRAMGQVRLAKKLGIELEEIGYDADGNETNDADKIMSLKPFGGYKGYGLNLFIELFSGLVGKMGSDLKKGWDRGYMIICINPSAFGNLEDYQERTEKLISEVKSEEGVRIPGERAEANYLKVIASGEIEIDDKILEDIKGL